MLLLRRPCVHRRHWGMTSLDNGEVLGRQSASQPRLGSSLIISNKIGKYLTFRSWADELDVIEHFEEKGTVMKMSLNVYASGVSPADLASVLASLAAIPDVRFNLVVPCQSAAQAGQVRRRVREALSDDHGVDANAVGLMDGERAPFVEAILPLSEDGCEDDEGSSSAAVRGADRCFSNLVTNPSPDAKVLGEGDFKMRIAGAQKEERPDGKVYCHFTLRVVEGRHAGASLDDKVVIWPVEPRTYHFAKAANVTPERLGDDVEILVGKEVWNRRKENVRFDGSVQMANFYFSSVTPPPGRK